MPRMSITELIGLVNSRIADCRQFARSELSNMREWAIRFYDGQCDIPPEKGRSQIVSSDLADTLEWVLPGLLRVFTASDRIVIYEPVKIEDEQYASQATDGINFIFQHECNGYAILHSLFHNALLMGNGPYKIWWEGMPSYETETLRGLTEPEFNAIISEPDVEDVLELRTYLANPLTFEEIDMAGSAASMLGGDEGKMEMKKENPEGTTQSASSSAY